MKILTMNKFYEYSSCDYCGGDKTVQLLEAKDQDTNERFKIVRCCDCGLVYLNPRPVKERIGKYYPVESYYSYQNFSFKRLNYRDWLKKISLEGYYNSKNILKRLISWFLIRNFLIVIPRERKGKLLDVGCGSGEFLNQMKGFGWDVHGVEINSVAASTGNRRNLNIFCGELEKAGFPDNFFEVVVLSQCLEHVYSPASYIKEIQRILKLGGTLIIGVPNFNCIESKIFRESWHALDVPRHLYFFTIDSLGRYLERCGFEVEKVLSKKFSLPIRGIKTDIRAFLQNKYQDKGFLNKILVSFVTVVRLILKKSLKSFFSREQVRESGMYIAFYARKPRPAEPL
jgi:SAM-dependent methyltransferase